MSETATVRNPLAAAGLHSCALAAAATLLRENDDSPEAEFLRTHRNPAENGISTRDLEHCLLSPATADLPLLELANRLGLNHIELLSVSLASTVETDLMCGRAIAHLQAPLGGSRPTLGLLSAAFAEFGEQKQIIQTLLSGAAVQSGLLRLLNEGAPLAERAAAVPIHLCLALNGRDTTWPGGELDLENIPEVPLPPSISAEARKQAAGLSAGSQRVLVLRTGSVAEGRSAAGAIAAALGRGVLFVNIEKVGSPSVSPTVSLSGLGPWLLLRRLIPVFYYELGPGERRVLPSLPHYAGPELALCGPDGSLEFNGETAPSWRLCVPPKEERRRLWNLALRDPKLADDLASNHRHGCGRIAQVGHLARHLSLLEGRPELEMADVVAASWVSEGAGLEALAQPLPDPIPDEALVLTSALRDELTKLLKRCRMRDGLVDGLGASALARYRPGVRALFTGPSGTGKTLAAGWLATRLGLPLYRVDLASVTSKYIGETEKNLAQLLARAEQSEVILLFDEADSLFGKRTDVKDSNDRFANAQTNYLLQRIEIFDGITLLTSNSRARFDSAFSRRLDMIIDFPLPGPEERRSLWQSHLGANHRLTQKELNRLAAVFDLAGGHIRNVVLSAAVIAQSEGRLIEFRDVLEGLNGEYRKLSRQVPAGLVS
jgi:hypothetical protein